MNAIFATMYYSVKRFVQTERTSEIILALCVLGFGIAGYLIGYTPLSIGSAMTSLPFLWMGYFLNRKLSFFQLSIRWQWALLAGIGLLAVLHFTFVGDNFFYLNTYSTPLSLIYLAGLLGTLGILLLSRIIKWLPIVSYVGRYSIIVLCTHMAVVKVVINLLPTCWGEWFQATDIAQSLIVLLLTIMGCVFCCWILSKCLPWFTAQKDLF